MSKVKVNIDQSDVEVNFKSYMGLYGFKNNTMLIDFFIRASEKEANYNDCLNFADALQIAIQAAFEAGQHMAIPMIKSKYKIAKDLAINLDYIFKKKNHETGV